MEDLLASIEALIFASDEPVSLEEISRALGVKFIAARKPWISCVQLTRIKNMVFVSRNIMAVIFL